MDHREKLKVVEEIGRVIGSRFGHEILLGLVSGSVARGEDTAYSDLEVIFVTRNRVRLPGMSPDGFREFLLGDLQTQIEFRTKEEVISERLTHVGPYWPFQVWIYLEPHVFYGEQETVAATTTEFRKRVAALPDSAFREAAGHALLWVRGHLGKVRNAHDQGDDARAAQAAEWMGYEVAGFVALANRRYYTHADLRWLEESKSFPLLPNDYHKLMLQLHLGRDRAEALEAAQTIYNACAGFAARLGIRMEAHERLEGLGL
jgi:hypothetical protein